MHAMQAHMFRVPLRSLALGVSLVAAQADAASIEGEVHDLAGNPLQKVALCLVDPGNPDECQVMRATNRHGRYSFTGITDGGRYRVRVVTDTSARNRKFEPYPSYVWSPMEQEVELLSKKARVAATPIVGEFNFSNFQRQIVLTADDFPELGALPVDSQYIALKVFLPASSPEAAPDTIDLARVRAPENLSIEASLPRAATVIGYEVFGEGIAISGEITLRENEQ